MTMLTLPALILATLLISLSQEAIGVSNRESLVSQNIYRLITNDYACFRRMNATHQIGCTSKQGGSVGVVQLVDSQADIDWIVKDGIHAPYIVLLYVESFTLEVLRQFQDSERVSGVVLLRKNDTVDISLTRYSPDSKCPNRGYGFYTSKKLSNFCPKWNEPGSEILFQDWSFPIFYVSKEASVNDLLQCYKKFNEKNVDGSIKDWPLCAAELESFMSAAVDTPTCIRRNKLNEVSISPSRICDPLGDANLHTTLLLRNQSTPYRNKSVIVIAARLDASSMFDKVSPGADAAVTGITAILALIKQLAPMKSILQNSSTVSNIYFILFNGEAFDYIGSSRLVYDMMKDEFPRPVAKGEEAKSAALLHLDDILYYIELNQLALRLESDSYYVHANSESSKFMNGSYKTLLEILQRTRLTANVEESNTTDLGVPPSSLQSFLAKNPDFPGVVITNHNREYVNKYYSSVFDDAVNINYQNESSPTVAGIASLAATIATTIEELIVGQKQPFSSIKADPKLVNDILQCYITSPKCKLFRDATGNDRILDGLDDLPTALYVGVSRTMNPLTTITQVVMSYFQGEPVNRTRDNCYRKENDSYALSYMWIKGECYETTASSSQAESPAFSIENYDWSSGEYSTWTESIWTQLRIRIFLQASTAHQIITLVSGIIVFIASIVLFSWINANTEKIFKSRYHGYAPVPPP